MPTYQYRCTACSEPLEVVQTFTDAPLTECPSCGGALRKVFSTVGVVFKGSGFYQTDSRPAPKSDTAAKDGDGAKTPAASSDGAKSDGAATPADKPSETQSAKKKQRTESGASHKVA